MEIDARLLEQALAATFATWSMLPRHLLLLRPPHRARRRFPRNHSLPQCPRKHLVPSEQDLYALVVPPRCLSCAMVIANTLRCAMPEKRVLWRHSVSWRKWRLPTAIPPRLSSRALAVLVADRPRRPRRPRRLEVNFRHRLQARRRLLLQRLEAAFLALVPLLAARTPWIRPRVSPILLETFSDLVPPLLLPLGLRLPPLLIPFSDFLVSKAMQGLAVSRAV
jgi:hypothetical protein